MLVANNKILSHVSSLVQSQQSSKKPKSHEEIFDAIKSKHCLAQNGRENFNSVYDTCVEFLLYYAEVAIQHDEGKILRGSYIESKEIAFACMDMLNDMVFGVLTDFEVLLSHYNLALESAKHTPIKCFFLGRAYRENDRANLIFNKIKSLEYEVASVRQNRPPPSPREVQALRELRESRHQVFRA